MTAAIDPPLQKFREELLNKLNNLVATELAKFVTETYEQPCLRDLVNAMVIAGLMTAQNTVTVIAVASYLLNDKSFGTDTLGFMNKDFEEIMKDKTGYLKGVVENSFGVSMNDNTVH